MNENAPILMQEYDRERQMAALAPIPRTIKATGLSMTFLAGLVAKHLADGGTLSLAELCQRTELVGAVVDEILQFMRSQSEIEVLAGVDTPEAYRYALTERGRIAAIDAKARNGYVGPAPVPLHQYVKVVRQQTVHEDTITRDKMEIAFRDEVINDDLLTQLGPSLNSGRAIFIYGGAGTGKTYIAQRLSKLFTQEVLIPHAIAINDTTVSVFDPVLHKPIDKSALAKELEYENRFDTRWVACERPVLISGGELSSDMLECQFEALTKEYKAPLQLKANNGIFIIDDMGRQRVTPEEVFNRWIVPLEEKIDYLNLGAGRHFSVPFDLVLIFSTNLNPVDLADEAFLRRIGYKIRFNPLDLSEYRELWQRMCREHKLQCPPEVFDFVVNKLHGGANLPLLPCHPRDLLGMAVDRLHYLNEPLVLNEKTIQWAWDNYFVSLNQPTELDLQGDTKNA